MKNKMFHILKKEIRELFRDKKSLSMMLVIPFLIPLVIIGMSALFNAQANKDISEYNKIGFAYEMNEVEKKLAEQIELNYSQADEKELKDQFDKGNIDLYITKENTTYTIHGDDSETSNYAIPLAEGYLNAYKEYLQNQYLQTQNMDSDQLLNIINVEKNLDAKDNFFASYIISYSFLFIIMAITVSATYPATDTTAGEKERGTLETLLTFPIRSRDIIVGKFLSVSLSSIITGLLSLVLALLGFGIVNNMFDIYEGANLMLSPTALLFAVLVIFAYSFLISGLCIAIASNSKTFKEAQSALTPLTFISFFPGMIAFMANIQTTTLFSMVPFLNYTLLFTDITNGNYNFWHIGLMILSTIIYIVIILRLIIRQYTSEKVLFSN